MSEPVEFIDRESGQVLQEKIAGEKALRFCYENSLGKLLLRLVIKHPWLSSLYGLYQDSGNSKNKIRQFVEDLYIDANEAEKPINEYASFNEFFARRLKADARPICPDQNRFIMPGDGRVSVIPKICHDRVFHIKGVDFRLSDFLADSELAGTYEGGSMVIVRLCPSDYHRFHFPFDGIPDSARKIKGVLYSVNPIAIWQKPSLFCENERVLVPFTLDSGHSLLLIDVGATMVGKIHQTYSPGYPVSKGAERGFFTFGASTTVIVFPPNCITFDQDLTDNSAKGMETYCRMGASLGLIEDQNKVESTVDNRIHS